ncbi:hypothetical protein cce_1460 [Crocosphaera subtropica ATCC 51142]|uniref:Uncharacterized protein n=2 Tax=Crocosphaera TaxID=263510 RepID=B1WX66_CROS5|nr:hypothetical protein cce_1460 [Crocosphaera subtropica ATCC 51142]
MGNAHLTNFKLIMYPSKKQQFSQFSLLCQAIDENNIDQVKFFIKKGIDLEQKEQSIFTPLMIAVERGNLEIVRILLQAGALVNQESQWLLERSKYKEKTEILLELVKTGIDINQKLIDSEGETILMKAVCDGNMPLVKALIENGANVNIVSDNGYYALVHAAEQGYQDIFDYLLRYTVSELREEAEQALRKGIIYRQRLNDKLTENFTEVAALNDLQGVINAINNKVNINAFDSEGCTALYLAAGNHHPSIVHILLKVGANIELGREDDGETPLINSASDTYLIYPRRSYSIDTIQVKQLEVIKTLLKAGANVNAKTIEGWNALEAAANANNVEIVKILLSAGANVNTRDEWGDTVLSRAMRTGNTEIIQLLIKAGAKN